MVSVELSLSFSTFLNLHVSLCSTTKLTHDAVNVILALGQFLNILAQWLYPEACESHSSQAALGRKKTIDMAVSDVQESYYRLDECNLVCVTYSSTEKYVSDI